MRRNKVDADCPTSSIALNMIANADHSSDDDIKDDDITMMMSLMLMTKNITMTLRLTTNKTIMLVMMTLVLDGRALREWCTKDKGAIINMINLLYDDMQQTVGSVTQWLHPRTNNSFGHQPVLSTSLLFFISIIIVTMTFSKCCSLTFQSISTD